LAGHAGAIDEQYGPIADRPAGRPQRSSPEPGSEPAANGMSQSRPSIKSFTAENILRTAVAMRTHSSKIVARSSSEQRRAARRRKSVAKKARYRSAAPPRRHHPIPIGNAVHSCDGETRREASPAPPHHFRRPATPDRFHAPLLLGRPAIRCWSKSPAGLRPNLRSSDIVARPATNLSSF
jgi:hypothetical protein